MTIDHKTRITLNQEVYRADPDDPNKRKCLKFMCLLFIKQRTQSNIKLKRRPCHDDK